MNLGNSGGPMFNMAGEVIGIVSQKASKTDGHEGLGFAVTSNMAKKLLLEEKSVWSGVYGYLLTGDMAKALNLPQSTGFLIQRVGRGSLAARAGIRAGTIPATINGVSLTVGGDIVLDVMGIPASSENHAKIKKAMSQLGLGGAITITILRDGKKMVLDTQRMLSP
ncbi:MAG: trypsin-like serine protease [Nitrospirae bacterium]|nr:trypsin-like serine protease [Nitrospirota bacterium]